MLSEVLKKKRPSSLASMLAIFELLIMLGTTVTRGQALFTVQSISFQGNTHFSASQLTSLIKTKREKPFIESIFSEDIDQLLLFYRDQSYLHAHIDSIVKQIETVDKNVDLQIYLDEGKPSVIRIIKLEGCRVFSSDELLKDLQGQVGEVFSPTILERDIQTILMRYENIGYPLATVSIKNILFRDSSKEMSVEVNLKIDEGNPFQVTEIRVEGNRTTKDYVITREARIKENELYRNNLSVRFKRRLEHLQLFTSVSEPQLYLTEKNQGGMIVNVVEGNQNNFDGILGYVPPISGNDNGYFTGLVNLSLRNLFGTGRKLSARWFQENQKTQESELHYFEPWIASYPINVQIGFLQRKQDSTFVRSQFDISVEVMISEELSFGGSYSQIGVYPSEGYGQEVLAGSRASNFGVSIRYDFRDNPTTPSSGVLYSTEYEVGIKRILASEAFPDGTHSSTRRVKFDLAYYISPFFRQVLATELHLRDFNGSHTDISDLFLIGGTTTLRGYREAQFLGNRMVWSNVEYRFLVSQRSYFYSFVDLGYIVTPAIALSGIQASEQNKVGYGVGVRLDSGIGLIGVSFALGEGDTFSTSKIHLRLINEF
jgi:outer membrane protein insertion porin family